MAQANSMKSILFALAANGGIAIAKSIAAAISGSGAMMAEAIHSFADCGNQGLLIWGLKSAKKPPSPDFPLGYGKAIYFWSYIVALILFSMGGLFSIYEGIHKLEAHEPLSTPWLAVGVLIFSILLELGSFLGCMREVNKVRGKRSLWRWFRESRQAELLVVFGEDLAALFGLVLALAAVALTMITGNPLFDAGGTICIGVLLVLIAVFIGVEVKGLLIGESVEAETRQAIRTFFEERNEIETVLNLLTLQLGTDVMVAVKAKMVDSTSKSANAMIAEINDIETAAKQRFPQITWLFFEPDVAD